MVDIKIKICASICFFLILIGIVHAMSFEFLTYANITAKTNVEVNVAINESDLDELIYNWNGTNFTMYDSSLVLMFNFDNVSDLGETNTHIFDISGNGNNGTANGNAAPIAGGKYSGAYTFDGAGDYVQATPTGLPSGTNPRTIMVWIKPTNTATVKVPFAYGEPAAADGGAFGFYLASDEVLNFWGMGSKDFNTGAVVTTNVWHHIAVTYDGSNVRVYLDAVQVGPTTARALNTANQVLSIGSDSNIDLNDYPYAGLIDEVKIWNRTLSNTEIYQQYTSNLKKIDANSWELYVNQSKTTGLDDGIYTYQVFGKDSIGSQDQTEVRQITVDSTYPTISITSPTNNFNSSNNNLDITYLASDTNLDSCWYSNDTINTTLINCENITSIIWDDGQYDVTIWVNDTAGNINSSFVTFRIDSTSPTWKNNKTNMTSSVSLGDLVYFNITLNDSNPDKYIFSWYNATNWVNDTPASYTNGQEISVSKNILVPSGIINWTWYFNDTLGNINHANIWSIAFTNDIDSDGLPDNTDPLLYTESSVTTSGITNLNITVSGNETNESYSGIQEIKFYDSITLLFNFSHNFSQSDLDLSKVTIIQTSTSIIVNLSGQLQGNKTMYIADNAFVSLCVKDAEINSIAAISSDCSGANETDLTACLGGNYSNNGINCTDLGSTIVIKNLKHSAIRGTQAPSEGGSSSRKTMKIYVTKECTAEPIELTLVGLNNKSMYSAEVSIYKGNNTQSKNRIQNYFLNEPTSKEFTNSLGTSFYIQENGTYTLLVESPDYRDVKYVFDIQDCVKDIKIEMEPESTDSFSHEEKQEEITDFSSEDDLFQSKDNDNNISNGTKEFVNIQKPNKLANTVTILIFIVMGVSLLFYIIKERK
ncbi:LamG domain-containing protein [Candidatus Woesearchaeota archaeon]|nr:LamG domain-containing protein [Candidatus Woesearchaeota archaeon]